MRTFKDISVNLILTACLTSMFHFYGPVVGFLTIGWIMVGGIMQANAIYEEEQ